MHFVRFARCIYLRVLNRFTLNAYLSYVQQFHVYRRNLIETLSIVFQCNFCSA